jgi:hypothetical protein
VLGLGRHDRVVTWVGVDPFRMTDPDDAVGRQSRAISA